MAKLPLSLACRWTATAQAQGLGEEKACWTKRENFTQLTYFDRLKEPKMNCQHLS